MSEETLEWAVINRLEEVVSISSGAHIELIECLTDLLHVLRLPENRDPNEEN